MPSANFRAGVVAVVTNSHDQVLAFERSDVPDAWQLPQGGIDVGEAPTAAAWRELGEETGLGENDVEMVGEHPTWMVYGSARRSGGSSSARSVTTWFRFRTTSSSLPGVGSSASGSSNTSWAFVATPIGQC